MNLSHTQLTIILISAECLTKGGKPCKFPFIHNEKSYDHCIDQPPFGSWCAVEVDENSKLIDHGICRNNCPTTSTAIKEGTSTTYYCQFMLKILAFPIYKKRRKQQMNATIHAQREHVN